MGKMKTAQKLPPIEQLRGRPLGRILVKMGILNREKLNECLRIQNQRHGGVQIGQIFLELGLIDEKQLQHRWPRYPPGRDREGPGANGKNVPHCADRI